jgi:hypothetical protein
MLEVPEVFVVVVHLQAPNLVGNDAQDQDDDRNNRRGDDRMDDEAADEANCSQDDSDHIAEDMAAAYRLAMNDSPEGSFELQGGGQLDLAGAGTSRSTRWAGRAFGVTPRI